jgi:C-terminal processing protease CtpA/Prc
MHLIIFYCLSVFKIPKNKAKEVLQVEIQQTSKKSENTEKKRITEKSERNTEKKSSCVSWYGGIGVYMNFLNNEITDVIKGHPADLNGLIAGDVVLNSSESIIGDPGTELTLRIKRGAMDFFVTMTREKICTN